MTFCDTSLIRCGVLSVCLHICLVGCVVLLAANDIQNMHGLSMAVGEGQGGDGKPPGNRLMSDIIQWTTPESNGRNDLSKNDPPKKMHQSPMEVVGNRPNLTRQSAPSVKEEQIPISTATPKPVKTKRQRQLRQHPESRKTEDLRSQKTSKTSGVSSSSNSPSQLKSSKTGQSGQSKFESDGDGLGGELSDRPGYQPGGTLGLGSANGPQILRLVKPNHPVDRRGKKIEGTVHLLFSLSSTGEVGEIQVLESGGPLLNAEAKLSIRRSRFTPAHSGGKPIACKTSIRFTFDVK